MPFLHLAGSSVSFRPMSPKQRAAEAALAFVKSGMVVGLGTGSTADFFLIALAEALKCGQLRDIHGVPTSRPSEWRAQQLGIPLTTLVAHPTVDITVDGADEVDPKLDLIKGAGGALLREKIVAQHTKRLVIIADASKRVKVLGSQSPVPVEVAHFAHEAHIPFFRKLGSVATLRIAPDGKVFMTDNGNYIYDCRFEKIKNPSTLLESLLYRAGVVDCGLFLGMANIALIANDKSVEELRRE